jgi:hypothetical protein
MPYVKLQVYNLWKPALHLHLVHHHGAFVRNGVPSPFMTHMSFDGETGAYWPIVYKDEFWNLDKVGAWPRVG